MLKASTWNHRLVSTIAEELCALTFSSPAATIAITPALVTAAIAEFRALDLEPPSDMFMTAFPERPRAAAFVATAIGLVRKPHRVGTRLTKIDTSDHTCQEVPGLFGSSLFGC